MAETVTRMRGSSWGTFFDCSYRWYWENIEGLRRPSGGPAVIGSAIHHGSAVFDRSVMDGKPTSVDAAVQAAVDYIDTPVDPDGKPQEVEYTGDENAGKAKDMAVKLTANYCRDVAPTMAYTGIEVKCEKLNISTESGIIQLTGTTDRVRRLPLGGKGIVDFKSGKTAVGTDDRAVTKGHGMQLGVYTLMAEQETKETLGDATIIGFQTNSKLRIGEGMVKNPKLALVGTQGTKGLIEIAAATIKSGLFPPNPKSMLCSNKYCAAYDRCIYHD